MILGQLLWHRVKPTIRQHASVTKVESDQEGAVDQPVPPHMGTTNVDTANTYTGKKT